MSHEIYAKKQCKLIFPLITILKNVKLYTDTPTYWEKGGNRKDNIVPGTRDRGSFLNRHWFLWQLQLDLTTFGTNSEVDKRKPTEYGNTKRIDQGAGEF